jgi:hypothetical protein
MAEEVAQETVKFGTDGTFCIGGGYFVTKLAGARFFFGEGGSVAGSERGPWRR